MPRSWSAPPGRHGTPNPNPTAGALVLEDNEAMIEPTGCLMLLALAASPPPASPVTVADLSPVLAAMRREHKVPGIVAVVSDRERVIAEGADGVRVLGRPEPIRARDVVHIGSVTKPFTATLLATFVDEGRLRWETTLAEALPDLVAAMRPEYRPVTVAQLLSHEAGVQPFEDDASPEFLGIPELTGDARAQRHRFAAYALSLAPVSAPGTAFRYSNAGVAVAAAMAEAVTQRSWEDLLRERVLVPLGTTTAGFGWRMCATPGHPGATSRRMASSCRRPPTIPTDCQPGRRRPETSP
jgi:CubicO group peptidase (beta-lactamase class C family)